jgi:FAD/FMN-containing dehydrogenase
MIEEIKKLVDGEVLTDQKDLEFYSVDASAFKINPSIVVKAKSVDDLKKLVKLAVERKDFSITMRSAGTDMTGGPLSESLVIDINAHLNNLVAIDENEKTATMQPGLLYKDLEKETLKHNLIFPSYPASKDIASVGGIVSNNSGGEKTLRYGQTEDYVRSLRVILRDGSEYEFKKLTRLEVEEKMEQQDFEGKIYREVYKLITENNELIKNSKPKVNKNSTGYLLWNIWNKEEDTFDFTQVFTGSQGTLGIITEIKLGLVPVEPHSQMLTIYLNKIDNLAEIVNKILEYKPTELETYDDKTLKLALRFSPQLAKLISQDRNLIKFGLDMLPDFWIILKNLGLPKLVLMAEFTGLDQEELKTRAQKLNKILKKEFDLDTHMPKSEAEAEKYWVIRRQSFNLLRKKITDKQTVPFIDDIIVRPENLLGFWPKLDNILSEYPQLIYSIAGHAGSGNFHIIPLMDMSDKNQRNLIPIISERVYNLVLEYGGSLSGEHNDGLIRGPYLEKMYGKDMFNIFKEVKHIFDPQNIFNPGKKTDAKLDYAMEHLKKDNKHYV